MNTTKEEKDVEDQETELTKIKKQQETLSDRRKTFEKNIQGLTTADKSSNHKIKDKECKRRKLREELKTLEDYLDDYIKTTKTILEKIESELKKKEKLH